jgi:hypothetical protein
MESTRAVTSGINCYAPDLLCWQYPAELAPGLVRVLEAAGTTFPGGVRQWFLGLRALAGELAGSVVPPDPILDPLYVLVPAFDGGRQEWGPCQRVPGNALPAEGDECLLVLTAEDSTPWALLSTPLYTDPAGHGGDVLTARGGAQLPDWEPIPATPATRSEEP